MKQKHDQDLQKKLEDKETELKQKHDQDLQEKLEDKEAELKQKYDQDLQKKLRNDHESLEEKSKTVDVLRGQIAKVVQQLNDATETINCKQRKITELQENMEVQEFQVFYE